MLNDLDYLRGLPVSREIAERDSMLGKSGRRHYFGVGLSNIYAINNACRIRQGIPGGDRPIADILDFGCGYGRVARFIRAAFPSARVWVTDLDRTGVEFCVNKLGCMAIAEDPQPNSMDMIWMCSVLTHLSATASEKLLDLMIQTLHPGGLLIFSTQGRYSYERIKNVDWSKVKDTPWVVYNLSKSAILEVCAQYEAVGYGYADYPNQESYGISIVQPSWYEHYCWKKGLRTIYIQERGCDNHQDLIAFMRTDILDSRKNPFWDIAPLISG